MIRVLPFVNLALVVFFAVTLLRTNRQMIRLNRELIAQSYGLVLLTGLLVERAHGMIGCDICGDPIRVGDNLRAVTSADAPPLLAHADC
jgi:hypothetical protein